MESVKIVLLGVAAAVLYGIVQDQVTARVCLEYFTVAHPPVFATTSPTLLGLGWGVIATWWVGLPLGILLAVAARAGRRPRRSARELVRPVLLLLAALGAFAALAGVVGYFLGRRGLVVVLPPLANGIPAAHHAAFLADLWAHLAAYGGGAIGGVILSVLTWRGRKVRQAGAGV